MLLKAGTWIGKRTKVWDANGVPVSFVKELDTVAKLAVVYVLLPKEDQKLGRRIMTVKTPGPGNGLRFTPVTETVDATGWTYRLAGLITLSV